ncbi:hypothetical protein CTZ27_19085 [Streptomyces griseocarneus]|nr:hypothetical protein CTZ27_19085 [Streptomyces griseocarneus]
MSSPSPVTADDLDLAVQLAVNVLREAPVDAWTRNAGPLTWDCWETVEHLSDDLFAYAVQLGPRTPPLGREVPFIWESRRPGGPGDRDPWPTLLWATGRTELPGRPRLTTWRWNGTPR